MQFEIVDKEKNSHFKITCDKNLVEVYLLSGDKTSLDQIIQRYDTTKLSCGDKVSMPGGKDFILIFI